jgi:DNA end-binding protein Ku
MEAMRESGRCALATLGWKGKQYVVQVRPATTASSLQQLLYAAEVRSMKELDIEKADVAKPELQLALQLIDQISADSYDPESFKDEEKARILAPSTRRSPASRSSRPRRPSQPRAARSSTSWMPCGPA